MFIHFNQENDLMQTTLRPAIKRFKTTTINADCKILDKNCLLE